MPAPLHVPVLLDRVVALLAPALERDEERGRVLDAQAAAGRDLGGGHDELDLLLHAREQRGERGVAHAGGVGPRAAVHASVQLGYGVPAAATAYNRRHRVLSGEHLPHEDA